MINAKSSMAVAGIDVSKARLDVAVHGGAAFACANAPEGIEALVAALRREGVGRVGMEASGGYERAARRALEDAGFEVVLHQPIEVRLFARLTRRKAKNDRLDAALIAAATARLDAVAAAQDPVLAELAERLTAYDQIAEIIAKLKTCREHAGLDDVRAMLEAERSRLDALKRALAKAVFDRIRADPALLRRWRLLQSLPGFGPLVAAVTLVRMPELGRLARGQAASLLGVAPFDRDSGAFRGRRVIAAGRRRPRRLVYLAALAAKRFDKAFAAFANALRARGKPPKLITVAVMRKLIEAANIVLKRDAPWMTDAPA